MQSDEMTEHRKPEAKRRTKNVTVWFTPEERLELGDEVEEMSVSSWGRKVMLREIRKLKKGAKK